MAGKESKKKQLKTLITFSSADVYVRAIAEPNTSVLVEALLARHFGIEFTGDSAQVQNRRNALSAIPATITGGMKVPVITSTPVTPSTVPAPPPLELPLVPAATATIAAKPAPEPPLPDRPVDQIVGVTGAFEPAVQPNQPVPLAATTYDPGTRLCPSCGNDMGTSPHCLNCL